MISVRMHVGTAGSIAVAQDLYMLSSLQDLVAFLTVLNATPEVKGLKVYTTLELPDLYKTKITAESLGLNTLEKLE